MLPDDKPAFSVKVPNTHTVDELKKEIRHSLTPELDPFHWRMLSLYHINVKFDESGDQGYLKTVRDIYQDLCNDNSGRRKPLDEWRELSTIEGGFPKSVLHIFVLPPPSESINCG